MRRDDYYEARGFSIYYMANVTFNVVNNPISYARRIEDILGDMRTLVLMRSFPRHTNLHVLVREIAMDVLTEEIQHNDDGSRFLQAFFDHFGVACPSSALEDEDAFWNWAAESSRFHTSIDDIIEEVFHVLFNDVRFLQTFNALCAGFIEGSGYGEGNTTGTGTLKRVRIPAWARRAIFHRDKGECRSCKRSLAAVINRLETERYDHIVPLAQFGANDVTNLQLLCEPCNLTKGARAEPVSNLYQRAIRGALPN